MTGRMPSMTIQPCRWSIAWIARAISRRSCCQSPEGSGTRISPTTSSTMSS
jgi:hypothetical protein